MMGEYMISDYFLHNEKICNIYQYDAIDLIKHHKHIGTKVDAIITDPPYNISRDNNFTTMGRQGIDFGEWDKGFNQLDWIKESYDLLKDGGCLFIFNDWKNLGEIAKYAESLGFIIKDMVRWEKTNPMPRNRDRRYVTDFEVAVWLVKPKGRWTFNRQSTTYDRCKYVYSITPRGEKIDKGHINQKPLGLMKEIILRHTNEADVVFDPFIGSCTTGVACMDLNRNFIGGDNNEDSYNLSKERIINFKKVLETKNNI